MKHELLEYGNFYHIYNRGINGCDLFRNTDNYSYFLHLYQKYSSPVVDTYAWVLMKNHFHFLVKIKKENEIPFLNPESGMPASISGDNRSKEQLLNRKNYKPANQFSHLFNAYAKSINKAYDRTGSLLEHPFRRIKVDNFDQLLYVIYYIHHNPIHHGFCNHFLEYPWSSYLTMLSPKTTNLKRSEVLHWFKNIKNLVNYHNKESLSRFNEMKIDFFGDC